jgi:hypothetical protein
MAPVIQPKKGAWNPEPAVSAPAAENSLLDVAPQERTLDPGELTALHEFFQLLAEWDERLQGEKTNE